MKQTPPPSPKRPRTDLLQHEHEDPNAAPSTKREAAPSQYHIMTSGFQHTHPYPLLPFYRQVPAPLYNSLRFSGVPGDSYQRPAPLPQMHLPYQSAKSVVPYSYGTTQPPFYATPYLYQQGFGSPQFGMPEFLDHREAYEPERFTFPVSESSSTLFREADVETSHHADFSSASSRRLRHPQELRDPELQVTSSRRIAFTGTGKDSLEHCRSSDTSKQTFTAVDTTGVASSSCQKANPDEQKDTGLSSKGIRRRSRGSDKSNTSTRVRSAKVEDLIYIGRLEQDLVNPLNRVRVWKDLRGRRYYDCKCGRRKACHDLKRIKEHVLKHGS